MFQGIATLPSHTLCASSLFTIAQGVGRVADFIESVGERLGPCAIRDCLLRIEGGLWGMMVRRGDVPDQVRKSLGSRLNREAEITLSSVHQANRLIRGPWLEAFRKSQDFYSSPVSGFVERTPLIRAEALEGLIGRPVFLKLETEQSTGYYENRGATNLMLHHIIQFISQGNVTRKINVVTFGYGNAVQAMLQAARNLGVEKVIIYLPKSVPVRKVLELVAQDVEIHLHGERFEEAEQKAREQAEGKNNLFFISPFHHDLIAEGAGTIGLEISGQMAAFGYNDFAVVSGVQDLGLLSGLSVTLPNHTIIGVESELFSFASRSFRQKSVVQPPRVCHFDSLTGDSPLLRIDEKLFKRYIRDRIADVIPVPEHEIEGAIAAFSDLGMRVGGAAALPLAALLFGGLSLDNYESIAPQDPVVVVVSGKNIDDSVLNEIQRRWGDSRWRELDRKTRTRNLEAKLTELGFVVDGEVRPLMSDDDHADLSDVIEFVDSVAANLPWGWDLIDAFQVLNFGKWDEEIKKPRATFRSLGEYATREYPEEPTQQGNRLYALMHPVTSRASAFISWVYLIRKREKTYEDLKSEYNFDMGISMVRLLGEMRVIEHYLARPEWLARLGPELSENRRQYQFDELVRLKRNVFKAAREILPDLVSDEKKLKRLLDLLDKPIEFS